MREELNDMQLEAVQGGTVYLSRDNMKIGFSTLGQTFSLKNCTYSQALNLVDSMFSNNPQATDQEFDKAVRKAFKQKGWI